MYYYFAQFYPGSGGGYSVFFPDFPGCQTFGDNFDTAMTMAMDALTARIESDLESGEPLPEPSGYEQAKARAVEYNKRLELPVSAAAICLLVPAEPGAGPVCA